MPFTAIYLQPSIFNKNEITETDEIVKRIHETKLSIQVEEEFKNNGYSPNGLIFYEIYSPEKQHLIIFMDKISQIDEVAKQDIQKIVDAVSKANDLNPFIVDLQKAKN